MRNDKILQIVFILFFSFIGCENNQDMEDEQFLPYMGDHVIKIEKQTIENGMKHFFSCSAVKISNHHILTAKHCINSYGFFYKEKENFVVDFIQHDEYDLTIAKMNYKFKDWVELNDEKCQEPLFFGMTTGMTYAILEEEYGGHYLTNPCSSFGDSGGGLMCQKNNQYFLIGILSGKVKLAKNGQVYSKFVPIPIDWVESQLEKIK